MRTYPQACAVCLKPNPPNRSTCSNACRYELVRQKHRENGTRPPPMTQQQIDAARERVTGSRAPWWNGGRNLTDKGYVMVLAPDDYPFPESLNSYRRIREHRMVMELHLGRALDKKEVVHHISGDRTDNRIENLELHESHSKHMSEHSGECADRMKKASEATRSVPATCQNCGAEYRTNARSTGKCAACRSALYEEKRKQKRRSG